MPYRRTSRFVSAPDGSTIAFHSHTGNLPERSAEAELAERPGVLLTNGIGTSENFWRHIVADLEQDHRVVHWDYRGHGLSPVSPSDDYSLEAHVGDLERVTEAMMAMGTDGRAPHHVAFSMGVRVVLELYRRRPELVSALTFIAGGPATPDPGSWPVPLPGGRQTMAKALERLTPLVPRAAPLVHEFLSSRFAYPMGRMAGLLRARAPRADIEEFMLALQRMDPRAYWLTFRGLFEAPPSSDVLPQVSVPVQIVAAKNDTLVPLRELERMREALPQAQWVLVDDAGHAGLLEAGTEIAEIIRAFRQQCGVGPRWPGAQEGQAEGRSSP